VSSERGGVKAIPSITRDINYQEFSDLVQIDNIKIATEFVHGLKSTTLDDKAMQLDSDALEHLEHPPQHQAEASSSDLCLAIDLYVAVKNV